MREQGRESDDVTGGKGFIIRLCGVIFIFVGALDSMLFWKGGMVGHGFYVFLIATGLLLYAIGSIARRAP
jgi:hypothetical protein